MVLAPVPASPITQHSLIYPLAGVGAAPTQDCGIHPQAFSCIDQNRDGIICKSDLRETYSQLGEHTPPTQPHPLTQGTC